ncbi:hypothetical protein [Finegoldia magna]|uniref:hypothetical protein n=1 Tax=Finegoldia magna TaxID=1260 RepID=UPI001C260E08|nr:hypothetical protein [Finegoldia magna]
MLKIAPRKATALTIVNYSKYQDTDISKNTTETSREHQESIRKASGEHINNNVNNVNNVNNNTRGVVDSE